MHRVAAIEVYAFGLAKWAFIPIEPHPFHAFDDGLNRFISRAALVRILNTEDEHTLLLACKEPIKQSCTYSTDVKKAGRARRESDSDLTHSLVLRSCGKAGIYSTQRKVLYRIRRPS